jgi:hypothetical protein
MDLRKSGRLLDSLTKYGQEPNGMKFRGKLSVYKDVIDVGLS